ncbi:hypothetical protein [Cryobacterium tepidiphilum]|jgi:hypothetical protein|uniref:DUF1499 domain-containing protein n=1 Tax=Cryobacterium tepidiphilum TaxID=2486026 RepID=A0A3M8KU02_9MICO|nr:hypothetical protein [Cryobacterium tepidiphilum]RNE56781.1 hypothetical protein EEJ31_13155 [Cryobacterium tepidiphilum]
MTYPGEPWISTTSRRLKTIASYSLPVTVTEFADVLRVALHHHDRLVLTELGEGQAVVFRRTTLAGRADRIVLTFAPEDGGTKVDVTSRGIDVPGFDFGRYTGDLHVLFDAVRAEIACRGDETGEPRPR